MTPEEIMAAAWLARRDPCGNAEVERLRREIAMNECTANVAALREAGYRIVPASELDMIEELVEEAVVQGCLVATGAGNKLDSGAISTWAHGIRWLASRGKVEIEYDRGRRVIARWVDLEDGAE